MFSIRIGFAALTVLSGIHAVPASAQDKTEQRAAQSPTGWIFPDISALPDDQHGRLVRQGRDLITMTYALVGPHAVDMNTRFAGNNLACGDCHLEAGTKKFGLPIYGIYWTYPRYSARVGADISIEDRINSCMSRSMNGRPLPLQSPEMLALAAYVKFLSSGLAPGDQVAGHGAGAMPELDRPADPKRGQLVYVRACLGCHNTDGSGVARSPQAMGLGYATPPLWGADSFNDGAGMARLTTLANFVHTNMPHGVDYLNPALSVEDAWDVAAYVESQPRPHKSELDRDYAADLLSKPVDASYGPYADKFPEAQHKFGPFGPIRAAVARLKEDMK